MFPQIGVEFVGVDDEIYVVIEAGSGKAVVLLQWRNDSSSYQVKGTYANLRDLLEYNRKNFA